LFWHDFSKYPTELHLHDFFKTEFMTNQSTQFGGATTNSNQPKDNRKLIYGILIAALLVTWGYIFFDKSKQSENVLILENKISNVDSARNVLQQEFMSVSAKADSLTNQSVQLQGDLAEKNVAIQQLKSDIGSILKKKNATAAELSNVKQKIGELNGKIDGLFAEIEKLKGENQQLTNANEQLNTDKTQLSTEKEGLQQNLNTTKGENKQLEEKVDIASTLHASNIGIIAIRLKSSGKESETTTAKRADLIRISFNIDENRVTPSGTKDIYVVVTGSDDKVITEGASFTTRDEGTKAYTSKVSVNYEQNKIIPVSFDWKQTDRYKEGNYKIEIYNNGFKIGQGIKTLKKGGLFN
jgi:predicted nuclease with TOPRIM domain